MRKIHFDAETIEQIRNFINEGHTIDQTCNRFTLKYDTLKRVMFENGIKPYFQNKVTHKHELSQDDINIVCNLYSCTSMRLDDICKEAKLENYVVQKILDDNFSEDFQNKRKSKLYRSSKLGDKNPMKQLTGENHPNYKGIIDDGAGYLMIKKPDWWTTRKNSDYIYYHHFVFAKEFGLTEIPKGFVIHHIDGNKHNNDISNLALLHMSAHSRWHSMLKNLCKVQRLSEHGVGNLKETSEDPNA